MDMVLQFASEQMNADKIVVLDKGQIAEQGSHAELMDKGGIYKKLVDLQTFE